MLSRNYNKSIPQPSPLSKTFLKMSSLLKPTKQSTRALDVQSNGDESDTPRIAIIGAGLGTHLRYIP